MSNREDGILALYGVHKTFVHRGEQLEILRGIDLLVQPGESLALTGASGVGKSTLLNIMGSLDTPTKGVVKFRGQDVSSLDEAALCRFRNREIGFVFQFHHLLPELNALENAMMPALIGRYPRKRAAEMAESVLVRVGLGDRMTHRAGELSGGEQQRVAIARALLMKPRLILADEPTGNLDWQTGQGVAELLLNLNGEEEGALVVATHNEILAKKMSRRMELTGGRIG